MQRGPGCGFVGLFGAERLQAARRQIQVIQPSQSLLYFVGLKTNGIQLALQMGQLGAGLTVGVIFKNKR